jgi:maltooligosyltrehalose trehalohydrolase
LFQGQDKRARGTAALDLPPRAYVVYLENHDQIAHSAAGKRGHQLGSHGDWRALTTYLLLSPGIPLLFQGQEFSASAPFLFFADHQGELGRLVRNGRAAFLAQFASLASPEAQARLDDPGDPATFRRCVLDGRERECNLWALALHRDLIALRRDMVGESLRIDGATLNDSSWVLRYFAGGRRDRLLIVNLGHDLMLEGVAQPLLAPAEGRPWHIVWSSEDPRYAGAGTPDPFADRVWNLLGRAAVVLAPGDQPL